MPSSNEILAGLTQISREAFGLAILWHLALAVALALRLEGWRPSARALGLLAGLPLASVSVLAWRYGNPFNGAVFAALALALPLVSWRAPAGAVVARRGPGAALGWIIVMYAWIYPHFLADRSPLAYLVGAPLGLVPCPTLSLLIGFRLVLGAPGGRAFGLTLAGAGLVYGLIGVLRLGVWLDLGLLVGALALLVHVLGARRAERQRGLAASAARAT